MNWFGRKTGGSKQPSAVSSTSTNNHNSGSGVSRTQTANTVVNLRENIATQEKR